MRYKKREDEKIDKLFNEASRYGLYIRFSDEVLFYRKGFHWEYITKENIIRMHMRVEEVISHTSCCAENMDIHNLIVQMKSGDELKIHVCDGEPRMAENLFEKIKLAWNGVEFSKI